MEYAVVRVGDTVTLPVVLPFVRKLLPRQLVLLCAVQERVVLCPAVMVSRARERETAGSVPPMVTRASACAVPWGPVQVTRYVVVFVGVTYAVPRT
jgi:hypothetical protein